MSESGDWKIAIITPSFEFAGETFIREHIRSVAPGRTAVVTFELNDPDALDGPVLHLKRTPAEGLGAFARLKRKLGALATFLRQGDSAAVNAGESARLVDFLQKHRVRRALIEYAATACWVRSACNRAGVEMVVHYHGFDASSSLRNWRVRHAYWLLGRDAASFVVPSQFLVENLVAIGMPREKMHVLPCGVDVAAFTPSEQRDPRLLLAVCRLVEKKAPDKIIAAFAMLAPEFPALRLEIIGGGPLMNRCREAAQQSGATDRITLHGTCDNSFVRERMGKAGIYLQHSVIAPNGQAEGLPVAILEAMACGVPVVSTRHAGIPEVVLDGETGLLVDEHDVQGMADAVRRLLQDPDRATALGRAGRKRVVNAFSVDIQVAGLRRLLGLPDKAPAHN